MSDSSGTGNTAPGLSSATGLLFIWSLLTLVVRVWVKLRKSDSWGADDTIISLSFLVALLHVVATCAAITHGYGNPWPSISPADREWAEKALYAAQLLYVTSIGLTKVSTGFFSARMTRERRNVRFAQGLTVVCGIWTVASVFVIGIRADITRPWSTVDGSRAMYLRWFGVEIAGLVVELSLWATSIYFIWRLNMPVTKRLFVSAILSCRLVIIPIVGLRLWQLSPTKNPSQDLPAITANIYTEAALQFAFILASITCLKPFLRPFHAGYFVSTVGGTDPTSYTTARKSSRGDAYYMLSTARSTAAADRKSGAVIDVQVTEDGSDPVQHQHHALPQPVFSREHSSRQTVVLSQERERTSESADSDQMIISKTQEWVVTYEDDEQRRGARA